MIKKYFNTDPEGITNYPDQIGQPDHNVFDLCDSYSVLFMVLENPTEHEIAQIKTGTKRIRMTLFEDCMWMAFKFGDLDWNEAPYNPHLSNQAHLPQSLPLSCKNIYIVLVNSSDGAVVFCKRYKYNEEFTQCLEDGILYLLDREFSNKQYFPFLEAVQSQYSTEEIANEANCECYLLD